MQCGDVVDDAGRVLAPDEPYAAARRLYYFRALAAEPPIPFEATVLWQDDHLLVVDKPHFLPVMPSGKYLQETVLIRLKRRFGLDHLTPIHRTDRDTAGLVLFSVQPATRAAYHELFRMRSVEKTYECVAQWNAKLQWPLHRASRLGPGEHFMQQKEIDGEPNAFTTIIPLEVDGSLARYRLHPITGQRHQLRVQMAALGLPIVHDGIYPVLTPEGSADFRRPLQLLAQSIAFTDPLSGQQRDFQSRLRLHSFAELRAQRGNSDGQ
jgi:tRNA pseudouridine32 synthase/23S rRNA pseudouridine746 synthase